MSSTVQLINVLIANQEREMCELWQKVIDTRPGMSCSAYALTAADAVQKAAEHIPEVIIMDIDLPDESGIQAAKRILKQQDDILIIMTSAYADTEDNAYTAGAVQHLLLPVSPDQLTKTIRQVAKQYGN